MTHNPTSLQGRIEEYLAQRQYYNAIPMIDDLIKRVKELEGKLGDATELLTNIKEMAYIGGAHMSEHQGHCVYCGVSLPKLSEEIADTLSRLSEKPMGE